MSHLLKNPISEVVTHIQIAGEEIWCVRGHGFAMPRGWRLFETGLGFQVTPELKCAKGARRPHHFNARLCSLSSPFGLSGLAVRLTELSVLSKPPFWLPLIESASRKVLPFLG